MKVHIINDWVGGGGMTGKDEVENIIKHVKQALSHCDVSITSSEVFDPNLRCDLLIFDYGGMANGYSSHFYDYCRGVVRWMEDHPSSLLVIGSTFTYDNGISKELHDRGLGINPLYDREDGRPSVKRPFTTSSLYWKSPFPNLIIGALNFEYYDDFETEAVKGIKEWFS